MALMKPVALWQGNISSTLSKTVTEIPLVDLDDGQGGTLTNGAVMGFIIDEGEDSGNSDYGQEYVIGTVNTADVKLTSVRRGVSLTDGWTEVTNLKKKHQRNAVIKVSSHPYLVRVIRALNGEDQLDADNLITYDAVPTFTSGSNQLATVKYAEDLANAGAADASTAQKGLSEEATAAELTAGTAAGSAGRLFANPATLAAQIQSNSWLYFVEDGSGSDDAYTGTLTPAITAYTTGATYVGKFTIANTGACTVALNGLSAVTMKKYVSGAISDLETGDIVANQLVNLVYDGTYMILNSPSAASLPASPTSASGSFFTSPYSQELKTTLTYGEALNAGELVCVESDGKVYRTKLVATGSSGTNTTDASNIYFNGKITSHQTPTSSTVIFLSHEGGATNGFLQKVTADALYGSGAPTQSATSLGIGSNGDLLDSTITSDLLVFAYRPSSGAFTVRAMSDVDGTPSLGTALNVIASGSNGGAVETTSASNTYVALSNNGSNLLAYKITASGTTLTNVASATLVSGSTNFPRAARFFTGTDYLLTSYYESSGTDEKVICCSYDTSTGSVTAGSAVDLTTSGISAGYHYIFPLSSTKAIVFYRDATDLKAKIVTRDSTTGLTLSSEATVINTPGTSIHVSQISGRQFRAGNASTGKLITLDRDYSTITVSTAGPSYAAQYLVADALVTMATSGSDTIFNVSRMTTNLDGLIGFTTASGSTDATGDIITQGHVTGLTSLTAGSVYYPALNGGLTSSTAGTTPVDTTNLALRPFIRTLRALSSTTGIKI